MNFVGCEIALCAIVHVRVNTNLWAQTEIRQISRREGICTTALELSLARPRNRVHRLLKRGPEVTDTSVRRESLSALKHHTPKTVKSATQPHHPF